MAEDLRNGLNFLKFFFFCGVGCLLAGCLFSSLSKDSERKIQLDVPYEPTSYGIAREMLNMAGVSSEDWVYDLGCGDGRIVILAAKERGARGVGVDLDPERIRESKKNARAAGVTHRVQFFEQNLFETDIRQATVVMLYLYPEVNLRLRPKLLKELKPGTRIVSHSHTMGDWESDETRRVEGHDLHFFVVPANATGTWLWEEPDGRTASLAISQKFQRFKGTLAIGSETYPLRDCSLRGQSLSFRVERPSQGGKEFFSYEGRILGNAIQGRITAGERGERASPWQATRDPSTIVPIAE